MTMSNNKALRAELRQHSSADMCETFAGITQVHYHSVAAKTIVWPYVSDEKLTTDCLYTHKCKNFSL